MHQAIGAIRERQMLMGVNPQDSWLGVPAPTQACCPSRKCSQNQKMPLCAGRGPGSHRGGSLPHPQGKPQGTKALLKKSLPQHGGRRGGQGMRVLPGQTTMAGPGGRGTPAVSPELTPQPCAACSLHFLGGAAPRPPGPFLEHVPLPSPKSKLKRKKESLSKPASLSGL